MLPTALSEYKFIPASTKNTLLQEYAMTSNKLKKEEKQFKVITEV
jgi:hypothetical protein